MFSLFGKKARPVSLEEQFKVLAECGVALSPAATCDDLFGFHSRAEYEAAPYWELIPVLGMEMERDDFAPLCARLWMCDYERIEDHGSYADVIRRLDEMSEHALGLVEIADFVDLDAEEAWVEFETAGTRIRWDFKVDNDWLDPMAVVKFDQLLKTRGTPWRIYSNHTDFGQSAFFACLTLPEFERFRKLATFELREIARQV